MNDIAAGVLSEIDFSEHEKSVYRCFAQVLTAHISSYKGKYSPVNNIPQTLSKLAELIRNSALEECIQNNSQLIGCFINGGYSYNARKEVKVQTVIDFYHLVTSLSPTKQKILFDNIYNRLSTIPIQVYDEELPF